MAYINIDVDMDDVLREADEDDLVYEIKRRNPKKIRELVKGLFDMEDFDMTIVFKIAGVESLSDRIKFEAFIEKYRDIPEADLDEFLKKY